MRIITNDNKRLLTNAGLTLAQPSEIFVDTFERADGLLGNGWTDGWDWDSSAYDPVGIFDGSAVIRDPTARVGATYALDQFTNHPPLNGEQHIGIGCAWRDFGIASVYIEAEWSGYISIPAGHHVEGTPLVHVVPGSPEHGLGIWPSFLYDNPVFFIGGLANPPEDFGLYLLEVAAFTHTDGVPRKLGILTTGTHATFWIDGGPGVGTQISLSISGLNPMPIPANLVNSTLHGFALDTHFVSPPHAQWTDIPTIPVINSIVMRPN